jgi:glycosyltransferase involved in cell wall biosynthesis
MTAPAATPSFSVVFPTYNRCEVVRTTLERLLAVDYPADRYEIVVCDNSSDETPSMVRELAATSPVAIRLIHNDERLPAVKRNEGLRTAAGDLVLFLNDDVWVDRALLREHARTHAHHDGPIAVLGRVEQSDRMPWTAFNAWYQPFAYHLIADRADQSVPYHFHWSMNLSLPRSVMQDRQLVFHEDWTHIGHEDVELGYRWTRAGYEVVYNPRAWGEHFHPHDLDTACRLQESIGRGLRDLEALVPDPDLLERYGIFRWQSSRRAVVRGVARRALFNRVTVPAIQRRLASLDRRSRAAEWAYWKVMLHHTNRGYRTEPTRSPRPVLTRPAANAQVGVA